MKKVKVLHIVYSFGIGGLEKGIATLVNHASPEFEHSILCLTTSGASRDLISRDVPIVEMRKPPGNSPAFLMRLARTIRKFEPDVVHTRNWAGLDGIVSARLAGKSNIVHGEHGWGMDDPQGASRKRMRIRRWLSFFVKEFTAVSCQIGDWLTHDIGVRAPVNQIYNGIELSSYPPRDGRGVLRKELGLDESVPVIVTVGRLDPIKDHAGLFAAFELVKEKFPECRLVVVGDGPEMGRLRSLRPAGVHLLGMRTDVPEILRDVDMFALSSLNEGISNTILEAMACGLPIVATSVGGTPELITHGENGFLVEPSAPHAMAASLQSYLAAPALRASHGEINRRIIKEQFSINAMVSGYEAVWRRVARKG